MAGVALISPRRKFVNSSGVPYAGGSLTVYYAGTTDLATTYQDRALTTANTNPITLDANGECLLWVDDTYLYKELLKDASGATVSGYPVDNIRGGSASASGVSDITVDRFSGTGAQTEFTLSTTPTNGENSTEVYVGGVYIQKNAYSLSGAVLTFAAAPAAGTDNIEVNTFGYTDYAAAATAVAASASAAAASATAADASADLAGGYADEALEYRDDAAASAASAAAVSGAYVGLTRSAIRALDTSLVQIAHLKESGREGVFQWDSSDHSAFMEVENFTPTAVSATTLTKYGHNLDTGAGFYIESAAYGLTPYVLYFAGYVDADEFRVADSFEDAKNGVWRALTVTAHVPVIRHADPHEGRFIIPNGLKCDGSQGAWVRAVDDTAVYQGAWWGLDETFAHNQSIVTAALHACPEGATLVGPAGTFPIARFVQMRWREGQTLMGVGWTFRLEGPNSTTASSVIRVMKSNCSVIGVAGGKFTGQVPGELDVSDGNLSESCGVHIFPPHLATVENTRVRDCWFYDVDSGTTVASNKDQEPDTVTPGQHEYYISRHTWVQDNKFTGIRRQGVEVFCTEYVYVQNNTIEMTAKGVGFSTSRAIRLCGCVHFTVNSNRCYGNDETASGELGIAIEPASMSIHDDPAAVRFCGIGQIFGNYTENFVEHYRTIGTKGPVDIFGNMAAGNPTPNQPSSTVTISVASPAIVAWTGHLLPNGTKVVLTTTGTLPTGLSPSTDYYVVNATTNNFQLAATVGGAAIDTTAAGSGTHTATAPDIDAASRALTWFMRQVNAGYSEATSAPNTQVVLLPLASPGVVTWTGHSLVDDDAVEFATDGTLPTEVVAGTTYYIRNKTADTFELATTPGGASINFTGASSGTHYIIPERWLDTKNRTQLLRVFDNKALSLAIFFETQGSVIYQELKNNTHIGNGNNTSKFVLVNNLNDVPALERCEMTVMEGNISITNQLVATGTIVITNTRTGEYYAVNRNKLSGGSTGTLLTENGAVTTGTVTLDSPTTNELLPSGLWASHFNPPPDHTAFDLGSL